MWNLGLQAIDNEVQSAPVTASPEVGCGSLISCIAVTVVRPVASISDEFFLGLGCVLPTEEPH